jgi:spore coat protein JC
MLNDRYSVKVSILRIKFLREREVVHFQRFGEAHIVAPENMDSKNFYAFNPQFDKVR